MSVLVNPGPGDLAGLLLDESHCDGDRYAPALLGALGRVEPAALVFEHTADIAFRIHGEDIVQIHLHAQIALCFKHPELLKFLSFKNKLTCGPSVSGITFFAPPPTITFL